MQKTAYTLSVISLLTILPTLMLLVLLAPGQKSSSSDTRTEKTVPASAQAKPGYDTSFLII